MSALAFALLALSLVGPVPALLARAAWPLRAPRAAVVLWQAVAIAAVLSAFSAGIDIASRLLVAGPTGPGGLGWPLWISYVTVFALTLMVGARLIIAVLRVAIATRRRRARHRMLVDLVAVSHTCNGHSRGGDLRILDVEQPLAYCLPGV
ncbi:MAG TPA: M56 family peptidase, partial [Mycobacterium sp.]|nr:M56 family peptidase [Mycobacterium sp.]